MEQRMILLLLNLLVIISCYGAASAFTAAFLPSTTKKLAWTSSQLHSANINTDNQNQNQIDLASNSKSNISSSSTISTTTSSQTISSYTKTSQSSTFRDIGSRGIDAEGGNGAIVNAHVHAQADSADADVDANANVDSMDVASERQLMEQCLDYQAYTLGPTHIETMKTLHNLATFMYKHSATHTPPSSSVQQEKDESKKLYSICYNQQKCHLGQFHADTLLTLYNLFIIYYNEGHYDVVKGLIFEDVLSATNDAAHGGSYYMDWNILDTMLNLAFAYHCGEAATSNVQLHKGHGKGTATAKGTGALKEGQETAMKLYESFISSFYDYTTTLSHDENEHIQDPTHPNHYHYQDLLSAQHNLGVLYQNTGDYAKAKTIVEECYNCRLAVLGKAHHLTLGTMNNLAALCHKMGEYGRAKDLYCECYDVKRECLGEDHPDSELTFRNIQRLKEVFSF
eukprot:CAMPEP_0203664668 /NCGR_PEP_ID=MMETSP0090-20130426/2051_1 /ASSEMBLY_ACC=CAM_ASM_001088 /TAXON_ID=426623 /ORGANISM="Chaetoceros affinis, Strain CCMP159" /LENGTH=453 /DNA_ID=CAMNT_0050528001 /DNA_START=247 /DNA_END=1608 /DNA_ORIENTATION=+